MLEVDRRQVLAYRIAAHGLHRTERDPTRLAVFDLGVQDVTARDTAALALAARLQEDVRLDDGRFTLGWTHRGAPHYHRTEDYRELVPALFPVDDGDAQARMLWQRKDVASAGIPATEVLLTAARALREAVGSTMTKGAASTAVTKLLPASLTRWCRGCQATHIHEQLMRLAAPFAGLYLEPGASPATLSPLADRPDVPTEPDLPGARSTVERYLRLHGPATAGDAAGFVGTARRTVAESLWPTGLNEVRVDGRAAYLPGDEAGRLEHPPEPDLVRLLPPWDPFLQSRDRDVLVPDRAHQKELWKMIGNPGALLAGGEVAGGWRTKSAGRRLEVTVSPFWPLPEQDRAAAEAEAERVATTRGFDDVRIRWQDS